MKKVSILFLVALLLCTAVAAPAMAYEPTALMKPTQATERNRYRRHDRRRGHRGNDWVGFGIGAAVGALIASGVTDNSNSGTYYAPAPQSYYAPAPQQVLVYDPSCNCYYYVQQ